MRVSALIALTVIMVLSGCAQLSFNSAERELSARERRYNAALHALADGSTRADLERLFPCTRPGSFSPGIFSVDGVFIFPPEQHPIDKNFVVSVTYLYSHVTYKPPRRQPVGRTTRLQRFGISAAAIDALLFGGRFAVRIHPSASDLIENFPLRVERRQKASP